MRRAARQLRCERGDGLIDTLLILTVVLLVVVVTIQTLLYAHARSIATGAAQDGARAAAADGSAAGVSRATRILAASGGTSGRLAAIVRDSPTSVTVEVVGEAPHVFPVGFAIPRVKASATLPIERYPVQERVP